MNAPARKTHDSKRSRDGSFACIALGANIGDRRSALRSAIRDLDAHPGVEVLSVSMFYETDAVTLPGAEPQPTYLNAAAVLRTTHPPRELLEMMLEIERAAGRRRDGRRWASRTLDLDLLLYDDQVIDSPGLTLPHPEMTARPFVLTPLAEIAPERVHPVTGRTIARHLSDLSRDPHEKVGGAEGA